MEELTQDVKLLQREYLDQAQGPMAMPVFATEATALVCRAAEAHACACETQWQAQARAQAQVEAQLNESLAQVQGRESLFQSKFQTLNAESLEIVREHLELEATTKQLQETIADLESKYQQTLASRTKLTQDKAQLEQRAQETHKTLETLTKTCASVKQVKDKQELEISVLTEEITALRTSSNCACVIS